MVTISQPFKHRWLCYICAGASSASVGNTVCRADDTAESTLFFFSFFSGVIDQEVFVGRPCKALFGNPFQESFFVQCSRVRRDNVISPALLRYNRVCRFWASNAYRLLHYPKEPFRFFQLRELTVCTRAFGMVVPNNGSAGIFHSEIATG